jgi:hypothetical protein
MNFFAPDRAVFTILVRKSLSCEPPQDQACFTSMATSCMFNQRVLH